MADETSQLNVRIDSDLVRGVRERAEHEERTVAAVVSRAIRQYLSAQPQRAMAGDEG